MPLDITVLGEKAMKCRAFAKALHYKEEEFHRGPTTQILESLIRFTFIISIVSRTVLIETKSCHASAFSSSDATATHRLLLQ